MVKCVRVSRDDEPTALILPAERGGLDALVSELEAAWDGDTYTLTIEHWTPAELDALPEWDGW